jgi:pimeloyl-ACP methyl ester carboxylesterase
MAKKKHLPRNPRYKYHFKFPLFEFFFQWICGTQTTGLSESGELFYTASKIKDGDGESWYREWTEMGKRVEKRAVTSAEKGHYVSARESYLRAYTYYRAAPAFMNPGTDSRVHDGYLKGKECFLKFAGMCNPPVLPLQIPFEGHTLPGYLVRPADDGVKRKTLLMIGGGDTCVEDLYGYIGPASVKRDYNLVIVDLPGQGETPYKGLTLRHDTEVPVKAVIDHMLGLPGIDTNRIVMYGLSFGGYFAPRAATREKRIKALAVCAVMPDAHRLGATLSLKIDRYPFVLQLLRIFVGKKFQSALNVIRSYYWKLGARNSMDVARIIEPFKYDVSMITCPFLNVVGQQEHEEWEAMEEWEKMCAEQIKNPDNKLVVAPFDEGGDSHGVGTNLSLMSQIVFDWFDEIMEKV